MEPREIGRFKYIFSSYMASLSQINQWLMVLRIVVHTGLALALAGSIYRLVVTLHERPSSVSVVSSIAPNHDHPPDLTVAGQMFGVPRNAPTKKPSMTQIPDVKLVGIIKGDNPNQSLALIETEGTKQILKIGMNLPDGETVQSISTHGITLTDGATDRPLDLEVREAPVDSVFPTLPIEKEPISENESRPDSVRTQEHAKTKIPIAQQLVLLRKSALRVLAERAHKPVSGNGHAQ